MSNSFAASLRQRMSGLARHIGTGFTVAALVFVAACSTDGLTAPVQQTATPNAAPSTLLSGGQLNLVLGKLLNSGLQRSRPLANNIVVTANIPFSGGAISVPAAGLTLVVPAGAVPRNGLTITVTALAGNTVAYEFEPHGTVFMRPLSVKQSLIGTSLDGLSLGTVFLRGGYFRDLKQVNLTTGKALLDEFFPIVLSGRLASFDISHFSGYMVSMD